MKTRSLPHSDNKTWTDEELNMLASEYPSCPSPRRLAEQMGKRRNTFSVYKIKMMIILDLYCGGGGAGAGYARAGFKVVGVDIKPQPHYPFEFEQADAIEYVVKNWMFFDAIHASPVCKRYSTITRTAKTENDHPDQIDALRKIISATGKPYVIENVPGAPLNKPFMLCGTMFNLNIIRHRHFEVNWPIEINPFKMRCQHMKRVVKHGRKPDRKRHYAAVTGHFSDVDFAKESMGIGWLGQDGLSQAIPPAYTEFIGKQLMSMLRVYETFPSKPSPVTSKEKMK